MATLKDTQITRREFVIAAGGIAGIALVPGSLSAAPSVDGGSAVAMGSLGSCSVSCDFINVDGILRPRAWRLAGGTTVHIQMGLSAAEVVVSSPVFTEELLRDNDFRSGYAQELIRQRFGEEVLRQVCDERDHIALQVKRS